MTIEEAIKVLRTESVELGGNAVSVCRFLEALDMAIAALREQEGKDTNVPTNADRIRSMSDKELVRIRYRGAPHCKSDDPMKCNRHDFLDGMSPCELCYYEWLQQPAEDDDHSICGATNLPCIRCNPGGCDNRKEGDD